MQVRFLLTTSATALLLSAAAGRAQDGITTDGLVGVRVEGSMIEVPVSLAAQACGLDEATILANAFTEEMDGEERGEEITVAPDPMETAEDMMASEDAVAAGEATDMAQATDPEAQPGSSNADDLAAADVADEAAIAAAVGDDTTGVPDTATAADNSADSATADEAAETVDGIETVASEEVAGRAACEIDRATADQFGFPTGG